MKDERSYYKLISYIDGSGETKGLIIKYYTESEVLYLREKCGIIYEKLPKCKMRENDK